MQRHRTPFRRVAAKAKAKAQKDEGNGLRYVALFIASAIVLMVVSQNLHAEEGAPQAQGRPTTPAIWTDHNTHDPGLHANPNKVREMQVELAAEEAPPTPPAKDEWLLQIFGVDRDMGKN